MRLVPTRKRALALGVLLLTLPAGLLTLRNLDLPHVGRFWDEGIYIVSAKSIAEGSGYRILSAPGQPYQTKFPPLYPLLLSIVWKLSPHFPENLRWMALVNFMALPIFLLLLRAVLLDMGMGSAWAWAGCAMAAASGTVLTLSVTPMSELLFCCFAFGTLLMLRRLTDRPRPAYFACLAGLLGGAAYLTRTAGLPLLLAGAVFFILKRQFRQAIGFCVGMLPAILGWNLWIHFRQESVPDYVWAFYTSYSDVLRMNISLHNLPVLLAKNWLTFTSGIGSMLVYLPFSSIWWTLLLSAFGMLVLAAAMAGTRRSGFTHYHFFFLLYGGMLLLWPYSPTPRFLLPLLPVLLAALIPMARRVAILRYPLGSVLGVALFAGWSFCQAALLSDGLSEYRSAAAQQAGVYSWIRTSLPESARFVADTDSALYLYTGRQGISYQMPMDIFISDDRPAQKRWIEALPGFADRHGIRYVVVTPGHSNTGVETGSLPYEQSFLEGFETVYASNGISIRHFH
jgi:hypothetical protein